MDNYEATLTYVYFVPAKGLIRDLSSILTWTFRPFFHSDIPRKRQS